MDAQISTGTSWFSMPEQFACRKLLVFIDSHTPIIIIIITTAITSSYAKRKKPKLSRVPGRQKLLINKFRLCWPLPLELTVDKKMSPGTGDMN